MASSTRRCFSCGYDLAGVTSERCPECGRPALDERDVLDHSATKWRRSRWIAGMLVIAAFVFYAFVCSGVMWMWGD
jgi:hypothetical protein